MNKIPLSLYLVAIIFSILIAEEILLFINIGLFSLYWLSLLIFISTGVLLKSKTMRWIMLFALYLSLFYGLIGTEIGMSICFSHNLTVLKENRSLSTFLSITPYLLFTLAIHLIPIYLLSHKSSCDFFGLKRTVWIHETGVIGTIAFWIIYEDMIYTIFLK